MPIRYDALLCQALARELHSELSGRRIEELRFDPERRRARLVLSEDIQFAWLLHPSHGQLLRLPFEVQRKARRKRDRGVLPFAAVVTSWRCEPDERRLVADLACAPGVGRSTETGSDHRVLSLVVELHTNQWNVLVVDRGRIDAVLWSRRAGGRSLSVGAEYAPPAGRRRWAERPPTRAEWSEWWQSGPRPAERLVREVAWTSRINADFLLGFPDTPDSDAESVRARLCRIHPARSAQSPVAVSGPAWNLERKPGLQPYPAQLGERDALRHASLLDAMRASADRSGLVAGEWSDVLTIEDPSVPPGDIAAGGGGATVQREAEELLQALRRRLSRARKRQSALHRQLDDREDSAGLRAAGQLLLARASDVPRGAASVRLVDFEGRERTIALDPAANAIANAERYFQRARRRERAERRLPARIDAAKTLVSRLVSALERLDREGPDETLWRLAGGRVASQGRSGRSEKAGIQLPYRRFRSSNGLEIRAGRSARANDELTFHHSAPEDVWLHARQARGAHVILRWGRREQNPPAADLHEAAIVAAEFSEARGSAVVAVDWTRRKHVRKPRKAPPGAVIPDRVKTLFVKPDRASVRRMETSWLEDAVSDEV